MSLVDGRIPAGHIGVTVSFGGVHRFLASLPDSHVTEILADLDERISLPADPTERMGAYDAVRATIIDIVQQLTGQEARTSAAWAVLWAAYRHPKEGEGLQHAVREAIEANTVAYINAAFAGPACSFSVAAIPTKDTPLPTSMRQNLGRLGTIRPTRGTAATGAGRIELDDVRVEEPWFSRLTAHMLQAITGAIYEGRLEATASRLEAWRNEDGSLSLRPGAGSRFQAIEVPADKWHVATLEEKTLAKMTATESPDLDNLTSLLAEPMQRAKDAGMEHRARMQAELTTATRVCLIMDNSPKGRAAASALSATHRRPTPRLDDFGYLLTVFSGGVVLGMATAADKATLSTQALPDLVQTFGATERWLFRAAVHPHDRKEIMGYTRQLRPLVEGSDQS